MNDQKDPKQKNALEELELEELISLDNVTQGAIEDVTEFTGLMVMQQKLHDRMQLVNKVVMTCQMFACILLIILGVALSLNGNELVDSLIAFSIAFFFVSWFIRTYYSYRTLQQVYEISRQSAMDFIVMNTRHRIQASKKSRELAKEILGGSSE